MARVMKATALKGLCVESFPDFLLQRQRTLALEKWIRNEQARVDPRDPRSGELTGAIHTPDSATAELKSLRDIAPSGFAGLVVTALAQTAYVEGVRIPKLEENLQAWQVWRENKWAAKQTALHRAAIGHGLAYGLALPGVSRLSGGDTAKMRAISASRMAAWYDEDDDEWPLHALEADQVLHPILGHNGEWTVRVYDEAAVYYLSCENNGREEKDWTFISYEEHGLGVAPIVRYANRLDLDGRATGEIEPIIPMLRRIDQTTYDRLIVQRFGAWKVRYIAGMARPDQDEAANQEAMELKIMDILISESPDTKFGTLDASEIKPYLESGDADLRYLAAITQTPPHHLLGLSSNLQAEALAAAEAGLLRKSADFRTLAGESHEQMFRLVAQICGNKAEATAPTMQVRWKDTESRSLVQTANALTLLAQGLGIPSEMLWERLPGWSDEDAERAKLIIEKGGIDQLLAQIAQEQAITLAKETQPEQPKSTGGSDNEPKS